MASSQATTLELGDLTAEVIQKDIKHVHLSVHPPAGRLRIAAPRHMSMDTLRLFAVAKLPWIRRQQRDLQAQEREPPREYIDQESHYVWGRRRLLTVEERPARPGVTLHRRRLTLNVRPGTGAADRRAALDAWYRQSVRDAVTPLLDVWQKSMKVKAGRVEVRRMRTKWGSCTPATGNLRLNTELAKKDPACLEYVLVHELAHLIEPTHNARFVAAMDRFMPDWRQRRALLNRLPVRHEDWAY